MVNIKFQTLDLTSVKDIALKMPNILSAEGVDLLHRNFVSTFFILDKKLKMTN